MSNETPKQQVLGKPTESAKELVEKNLDGAPAGMSPLARLMQGRERPHRILPLPGFGPSEGGELSEDAVVAIVALRDSELTEARLDALKYLTDTKKMPEWLLETQLGQSMLDNEIQSQCLHRSLRKPKFLEAKYTQSVNEIRIYFEPDQRLALWNEYVVFQHERNPLRHIREDGELQELVGALVKESGKDEPDLLTYYDSGSLRSIVPELASLVRTLTKQLYSPTTSQNE